MTKKEKKKIKEDIILGSVCFLTPLFMDLEDKYKTEIEQKELDVEFNSFADAVVYSLDGINPNSEDDRIWNAIYSSVDIYLEEIIGDDSFTSLVEREKVRFTDNLLTLLKLKLIKRETS